MNWLRFKKTLSGLKAKDGVVSVLGNHDYTYYMNVDDEEEIRRIEEKVQQTWNGRCGWHLLMNEHFVLHRGKDSIYVAGTENFKKPSRTEVAQALYGIKKGQFVLMLQHIPEHVERHDAFYVSTRNMVRRTACWWLHSLP